MNLMQVLKVTLSYIVDVMDFWQISLKSGHLLNLVKNRAFVKKKNNISSNTKFCFENFSNVSKILLKFKSTAKATGLPNLVKPFKLSRFKGIFSISL